MAEQLHILHISPYYAPAWAFGGPVRVIYEIARRQAADGHTVAVVTTDALDSTHRAPAEWETDQGLDIYRCRNLSNFLAWRRLFFPPTMGRVISEMLPAIDVVHLHEIRSMTNALALRPLLKSGIPYIVTPHGGLPTELGRTAYKRFFDLMWGNRLLDRAAGLHAITDMERQQYLDRGLPEDRIVVIPNGIDVDAFDIDADPDSFRRRFDIPIDAPLVGFVGRLNPIKGIDFLIDAFAEVLTHKPGAILLLAGPDDGARADLEKQVERLGIGSAVRFGGLFEGDEMRAAAYRAFDVCVLPSRYEILGITLLESLLNATPVITTDRCGLAGLLTDQDIGRVVPFGSTGDLSAAILATLDDPSAIEQAHRGRDYVSQHLNWDAISDRWIDTYRAIIAKPHG
ncbi:MAG: glycosyltransferase family 4 protein [Anaerolineae bacterium]|nr:glycosyltransferase family 4 protein [Anaerolineae bacterium]